MSKHYIAIVEAVKRWLEQHPEQHITLEEMAGLVNCGSSMLHRAFKQYYQITLYAYQLKLRLEKAKQLIKEDELTLKEIAAKAGFKRASHFSTAFKKEYGKGPKEWRDTLN